MSEVADQDHAPLRIVVVDDNPIIRESVLAAVQKLNELDIGQGRFLELFEAEDGATAWQRILDNEVDLAIVDLYIPILDGLSLIERIRNEPETTSLKVLAISASIEDARVRSLGAGADQFLQKPFRMVDVVDAVCTLLRLDPP